MKKLLLFISILTVAFRAFAYEIPDAPKEFKYLNDYAKLFSIQQQKSIEKGLEEFYNISDVTVSVAIIENLYGENIESVSTQWFNKWGIGGDENKGLLILFSKKDKLVRFETGYGIEHILTDANAKRIQTQEMISFFKDEYYYEGFVNGLQSLFSLWTDSLIEFLEIEKFQLPSDLQRIYDPFFNLSISEKTELTKLIFENEKLTEFPIFICVVDDLKHFDVSDNNYDSFAESIDSQYREFIYETSKTGDYKYMMILLYKNQNLYYDGKQKNLLSFGLSPYGNDWYEEERDKFNLLTKQIWTELNKLDIKKDYIAALQMLIVGYSKSFNIIESDTFWGNFWMYFIVIGVILFITVIGFIMAGKSKGGGGGGGFSNRSSSNTSSNSSSSYSGGGGNSYGSGSSGGGGATSGW